MQIRREKEQELRANDVYWTKRLQTLEANLQKTNQILEKEYNDAVMLFRDAGRSVLFGLLK